MIYERLRFTNGQGISNGGAETFFGQFMIGRISIVLYKKQGYEFEDPATVRISVNAAHITIWDS